MSSTRSRPSLTRDYSLDVLRTLGIISIVLAHAKPPLWISELRNFDVTFMVLLSGLLISKSTSPRDIPSYLAYVWKRLLRLLPPAWLLLSLFFSGLGALAQAHLLEFPFECVEVITSFTLGDGIGFVWIIRVFVMAAVTAPLWLAIEARTVGNARLVALLCSLLVVDALAYSWALTLLQPAIVDVLSKTLFTIVPFGVAMVAGLRFGKLYRWQLATVAATCLALYGITGLASLWGEQSWPITQQAKYPPLPLYLTYGIGISALLFMVKERLASWLAPVKALVTVLSSNSLWFYLWHIPFFFASSDKLLAKHHIVLTWPERFAIMLAGASLCLAVQIIVRDRLVPYLPTRPRKAVTMLLSG